MSSLPLRFVLIGCGHVGAMHARVAASHPAAEVVAVCAPSPVRRERLARHLQVPDFADISGMLREVRADAALIASPDAWHVPHAREALEAGLHVFCEKPLGMSLAEARPVCALAEQRQLSLGVNFNRRFACGYRRAVQILAAAGIGELRQLSLQVTDGVPPPHVAIRPDIIFWTLLGHHLDLVRLLAGEVCGVRAWLHSHRDDRLIDNLHLDFDLVAGGLATISAVYRAGQTRTTERCELMGSQGGLVIDDVTCGVRQYGVDPDEVRLWRPNHFLAGNAFYESLNLHLSDFIDRLRDGAEVAVGAADSLRATEMAEAAQRSQAEGRTVPL